MGGGEVVFRRFLAEKQSMTEEVYFGVEAIDDDHGSSWRRDCRRRRLFSIHGKAIGGSMSANSQRSKALPAILATRPNRSPSPGLRAT
ncbi:hypothetical protein Prudu_018791 [Prunus dulcis]|uniref:Uncharacterized protein n=1 Tax=Prunus dulcis TaxID=3755 RepID=A0A4Y1RT74_PRUDU|nr:hypothetical protein Prudu_018791 [Prunus dulcis]